MGRARKSKPGRSAVLLELDRELLERLDRWWKEVGHPSRRAAITSALEVALAQHSAYLQREAQAAREPSPWTAPAPRHTADSTSEAIGRPITADLMDLRG
jgi:hypothetical protein